MTSVNGISATYDALDRVVEQWNGSSYAEILYSPVGKVAIMSGTTLTSAFVGLPGGGAAVYTSSGLAYYRHVDWLGSSRLASTQARGLYSSTAYAPFGEQYATSGTGDASFTGQNSDAVSSLYDFTFRRLSPSQGRWISPDPAGLAAVDPANPQTWNRYAYVANNPLSFIDPLGLFTLPPNPVNCGGDETCLCIEYGEFCGGGDSGGGGGGGGGGRGGGGYGGAGGGTGAPSNAPTAWSRWKSCVATGFKTLGNDMNPLAPSALGAAQGAVDAQSQAFSDAAAVQVAERGLTVPLRSSVVRAGLAGSEVLGKVSIGITIVNLVLAGGDAINAEWQQCGW